MSNPRNLQFVMAIVVFTLALATGCTELRELSGDTQRTLQTVGEGVHEVTMVGKELRSEYARLQPRVDRVSDGIENLTDQTTELFEQGTKVAARLEGVAAELQRAATSAGSLSTQVKGLADKLGNSQVTDLPRRLVNLGYLAIALLAATSVLLAVLLFMLISAQRHRSKSTKLIPGQMSGPMLTLAFSLLASISCAPVKYEWRVHTYVATEEVRAPDEPPWLRKGLGLPRTPPTTEDELKAIDRLARRQSPLQWKVVEEKSGDLFNNIPGYGAESIRAVVRDGMSPDSRSTATAGASKSEDGRSVNLFARYLRQRFFHASLAEASAFLDLELPPTAEVRLDCRPFKSEAGVRREREKWPEAWPEEAVRSVVESTLAGDVRRLGEMGTLPQNVIDWHWEVLAQPLADTASSLLVVSFHPSWNHAVQLRDFEDEDRDGPSQSDRYKDDGLSQGVRISLKRERGPTARPDGLVLVLQRDYIYTASLSPGDRIILAVSNQGSENARGFISFKLFCGADWDRNHSLFTVSQTYLDQLAEWRLWQAVWHDRFPGAPQPLRENMIGIELNLTPDRSAIQLQRGR